MTSILRSINFRFVVFEFLNNNNLKNSFVRDEINFFVTKITKNFYSFFVRFESNFQSINITIENSKSKLFILTITVIFAVSKKIFVEKTIYLTLIKLLSITNNLNLIVQATIDRLINTMFAKIQKTIIIKMQKIVD